MAICHVSSCGLGDISVMIMRVVNGCCLGDICGGNN